MKKNDLSYSLPNGWIWVELGAILNTATGGTPNRAKLEYFVGSIPWVKSGELNYNIIYQTEEKITKSALNYSSAKIFPAGTLLIALYGTTVGRLAFLGINAATNQAVCGIFNNSCINLKFIYYFLMFHQPHLIAQTSGGAQSNISQTILKKTLVPLPPLKEQDRIVIKIDELFKDLETGKSEIETALTKLEIYRQSIFKEAFDGKLTNKKVKEGKLPRGWRIVELKSIAESIQYGYTESASKEAIGPKFLRITDLQENEVNWDDVPYCKIDNATKKKYLLKEGDLVFARTGATVGKSYLIKGKIPEAVFASYLIRVRVNTTMNEKYLSYFFCTPNYWGQITEGQVGIGQPNVNGTKLGQLKIVIAPLKEQQKIVDELESKLTLFEKMKNNLAQQLRQSDILKQSFLQKAFDGKLVEQNPKDEHADLLLKRIRKEKEIFIVEEKKRQKERTKLLKIKDMVEKFKTILELLQESKKPISAYTLWKLSVHNDNIDAFYAKLKEHFDKGEIKELPRKGKESFLIATK